MQAANPHRSAAAEGQRTQSTKPDEFLHPTYFLDCDHPAIREFAIERTAAAKSDIEKAIALFYAVRDEIRYDPYSFELAPAHFRASQTLKQKFGWCVTKSALMAALCRACGIPARVGYADVRNHLTSPKLMELMQSEVFIFHGYVEIWLEQRWVKATPVFDRRLCDRFGVVAQEFDGRADSLFQQFDASGRKHMEYVNDRGVYDDIPHCEIIAEMGIAYPRLITFAEGKPQQKGFSGAVPDAFTA
ncbi:MAG: transglutaminase family protein [Rhizobium sp.]